MSKPFCECRDARNRMTKIRLGAIFLGAISVGGCIPDPAKEMAACQSEADRFYQTYHAINPDDPSSQYIIACMATKGYDFTISYADCDSRHPLPTQPTCYASNNWLGWIGDQFRHLPKSN